MQVLDDLSELSPPGSMCACMSVLMHLSEQVNCFSGCLEHGVILARSLDSVPG